MTRLEPILQLLQEEKKEQSIHKKEPAGMAIDDSDEKKSPKPAGGSMPIHKMSGTEDNKPPDGSSHDVVDPKSKSDDKKSTKPAGGSMLIHKMSGTEDNKPPDGSSHDVVDPKSKSDDRKPHKPAGGGTESILKNQHCIVN